MLNEFETYLKWHGPYVINEFTFALPVPLKSGVYRISIRGDAYRPDIHGETQVIYYGSSLNLTSRLAYFFSAAKGAKNSHSGGALFFNMKKTYGLDIENLEYRYSEVIPPKNWVEIERELLKAYSATYSRRPLLNRRG